jgi:tRNA threonylcarbamoyladenosine biosynthesis protein TsaB
MQTASDHPRVLAIETSSALGSVALAAGPHLRLLQTLPTTSKHCQLLMPAISSLCSRAGWQPASLDEIYVSAGPGSFTGLRIAITVARTLALALDLRVVAVPTMQVIAAGAEGLDRPPSHLAVALDAKRQQVYGAVFRYQQGCYVPLVEACLVAPDELVERSPRPAALTGEGLAYHADAFQQFDVPWLPEEYRLPRAEHVHRVGWEMARQGRFTPPNELVPIYIRPPEAEERWSARHARGGRIHPPRSAST